MEILGNDLMKLGAKEKLRVNPGGPSNRLEAPVLAKMNSFISGSSQSDARREIKEDSIVISHAWVKTKHEDFCITFKL